MHPFKIDMTKIKKKKQNKKKNKLLHRGEGEKRTGRGERGTEEIKAFFFWGRGN